jgi:3D (Asp-Asp-Asp) domain-containing protein
MFAVFALTLLIGSTPSRTAARPARAVTLRPVRMTATAFCDKGETRLGIHAQRGVAAADPRVVPLGSTIRVNGLSRRAETFLVADTGAAVKGRHIDLFMPSCAAARRFGRRPVVVHVVKVGDSTKRSAMPAARRF